MMDCFWARVGQGWTGRHGCQWYQDISSEHSTTLPCCSALKVQFIMSVGMHKLFEDAAIFIGAKF